MIKVAVIGSGFGLYGLLPAFNTTPNCKVVAICGKQTDRLINYCKEVDLKNIYSDWHKMLDNENLDALAIAVTPNTQYEISKFAIKKGLHIFAEKPLAATYSQAKELHTLASKKKIINTVDFLFPEIETWKKVKEILDKKDLGRLTQINVNWDFLSYHVKNKQQTWKINIAEGGGALSFYFSHSLYYLEYFAGKIKNLKSQLLYSNDTNETGVNLLLEFENNINGTAHLSSNSPNLVKHQLTFICEKGTIILENQNSFVSDFVIKIYKENNEIETVNSIKESKKSAEDERVEVVKKLTKKFISAIKNNEPIIPSFKEGARVQELIEKIRN